MPDTLVCPHATACRLPQLLRAKYGDNWESLLDDHESDVQEGDEIEELDEEAEEAMYKEFEALDEQYDEIDGMKEEELRWLVEMQMQKDRETMAMDEMEVDLLDDDEVLDEVMEEEAAEESVDEEEALLEAVAALPEPELSPSLVAFVERQGEGTAGVPSPYPESEWLQIYATALSDTRRFDELGNTWANLRVSLFTNFADLNVDACFQGEGGGGGGDGSADPDEVRRRVRQRALLKARTVAAATGMPAIAASSSMQIAAEGTKPASECLYEVDGIGSGDSRVDALVERARQNSEREREVEFRAAASFVGEGPGGDGVELNAYAEFIMPIEFAGSQHVTVALSAALDELLVRVSSALELKFVGTEGFDDFYSLQEQKREGKLRKATAGATLLREKVLREAEVLDADILKVSSFLNHQVDVELMEACGEELAERLEETQPTKVLTVEATGLLPAMFVGKALGVPVVFARKSRQVGVADSYQASYKSTTQSEQKDLYVSTEYLQPGDRIVLVDDFLAGGATADAMVRLCKMANAQVVAGGFLIEKLNDAGRAFLSGYQIPLEALAMVSIEAGNRIVLADDGADDAAALEADGPVELSQLTAVQLANKLDNLALAAREAETLDLSAEEEEALVGAVAEQGVLVTEGDEDDEVEVEGLEEEAGEEGAFVAAADVDDTSGA